MASQPENPLSKEQIDELIQKIKDCDKVQAQIDMAKRAKVPIGDAETRLAETRKQLMDLKNVYAPQRVIS